MPVRNLLQRHRTSITVSLTALLLSAGQTGFANSLPDPGFEEGRWNVGAKHKISRTKTRTGGAALEATSNRATNTTTSRRMAVTAGDEYVYDAYVAGTGLRTNGGSGDTPLAVIRFYRGSEFLRNGEGKRTEGYRWVPKAGTFGYTNDKMQMRVQVPAGANGADLGVRTWKNNFAGTTHWDDISFKKLSFPARGAKIATLQAESANTTGGAIKRHHKDYTGTGYLDVTGNTGVLRWNGVAGGKRIISVRYSWEGFIQPLTIEVNGRSAGSAKPTATGRRGLWASYDFPVDIPAGNSNVLTLKVGRRGGALGQPMIDRVDVYADTGSGSTAPPAQPGPNPPSADLAAPKNLAAKYLTARKRTRLTWTASPGALKYQIARRSGARGSGQRLANTRQSRHIDKKSGVGPGSQYRVRACSRTRCGSWSSWRASRSN